MNPQAAFNEAFATPEGFSRTLGVLTAGGDAALPEARVVKFTTAVNEETARRWLPPGLSPTSPARATLFIAHYPVTSFGVSYRESGLLLHAEKNGREVTHCAWMVVDNDTAMILGRELFGFPKRLATIEMDLDGGKARGRVERRGAEVLSIEAEPIAPAQNAHPFALPIINTWGPPGPFPGFLLRMNVTDRLRQGWRARLKVRVGGGPFDPLEELGIGTKELEGETMISDIAVPPQRPSGNGRASLRELMNIARNFGVSGIVSPRWLVEKMPFRFW